MEKQQPRSVRVRIKAEGHVHNGKPCKPGESITVTPEQRDWLREHRVINQED